MPSGYKTITPLQWANIVWALEQGRIDHHAVRVYLACFVLVAVREAARRSRRRRGERPRELSRYRVNELERLTRLSARTVRRTLRHLCGAGLLRFAEGEIAVANEPLPGSEILQTELAGRRSPRRPIPVPRSMLRFLAQNRAEALTKVVIGYLVRGLSIARQTGELNPHGTVKASWIAETFGLSQRAVKYAQATLRSLGWISKDTQSRQRKLNRDGAYFTIDLEWEFKSKGAVVKSDKSETNFAPPALEIAPPFAPPKEDRETSYEDQDQETQATEPDGVYESKGRETRLPPPSLRRILAEDFYRFDRMESLHRQVVARGWINDSEAMALNFLGAAVRAREHGHDPARLFVAILRQGLWLHITQAQEEQARRALARFREDNPARFRLRPETQVSRGSMSSLRDRLGVVSARPCRPAPGPACPAGADPGPARLCRPAPGIAPRHHTGPAPRSTGHRPVDSGSRPGWPPVAAVADAFHRGVGSSSLP